MKIIYNSISDDLVDLISKATMEGRTIKYIKLYQSEWEDLYRGLPPVCRSPYDPKGFLGRFDGVNIVGHMFVGDING